ncbi:MAG: acyltransferase [Chloroflexota bacterium]
MTNDVYVHPNALVESEQIGDNTKIWAFAHILKNVQIGENCNIGDHCFAESGAIIGNNVTIKNGNMIWDGVTIEDGVFVGPRVFFTNDLYPRSPRMPEAQARYEDERWLVKTRVKYGASLGAAAVILAGTTIGEFAMVAAGSVVSKDVPPYALVVGTPAKVVGWVCQCGERLHLTDNQGQCETCQKSYVLQGGQLTQTE